MVSYWCCFWRASETELHCWKLRVLPSSLFISSRWAFFSASMAAEGDNGRWGIRLCQLRHIWGNHARELAELFLLQAPRPVFADSLSFPSALRASPTFSMPQDHPDGPNAAENNTVQCGSSPPPLPALPAYKKVLAPSHLSTETRPHFPQHLYTPSPPNPNRPLQHRSEEHKAHAPRNISLTPVGSAAWLQMTGMTGFWQETFGRGGRDPAEWGHGLVFAPTCCCRRRLLCEEPLLLLPQPLQLPLVVPLELLHHLLVGRLHLSQAALAGLLPCQGKEQ